VSSKVTKSPEIQIGDLVKFKKEVIDFVQKFNPRGAKIVANNTWGYVVSTYIYDIKRVLKSVRVKWFYNNKWHSPVSEDPDELIHFY
jgi:hypothetical protein